MPGFEVRRRQQQFAFFFGMMCLALCACTDGTSTLLVLADGDEAGSSGTGNSTAGRSGTNAIDAGAVDDDDEPVQTSECRRLEAMWPAAYSAEEQKLIGKLNELRANPTSLCASPFTAMYPLEPDSALQCASRIRARDEYNNSKPGGAPPYYAATYYAGQRPPESSGTRDREKRAGSTRIDAEIIYYNVNSAMEMMSALEAKPDKAGDFCFTATNKLLPYVGIGRSGSVWVIDFSGVLTAPTHPPVSGTGPSGPGNSGTGGR